MPIGGDMPAFSPGVAYASGGVHDPVAEGHPPPAEAFETGSNHEFPVVKEWLHVAALDLHDRKERFGFPFQTVVAQPQFPKEFEPRDFEPDQMVRVVSESHLIGLGVAHPESGFGDTVADHHGAIGFGRLKFTTDGAGEIVTLDSVP